MKLRRTDDRRKNSDRRRAERFQVGMPVSWEGSSGLHQGTLSDLSVTGCFILGSGEVELGDQVRVDIPLSSGGKVSLWGDVVNHEYDIGLGLRFVGLTESQKVYLKRFTETLLTD